MVIHLTINFVMHILKRVLVHLYVNSVTYSRSGVPHSGCMFVSVEKANISLKLLFQDGCMGILLSDILAALTFVQALSYGPLC